MNERAREVLGRIGQRPALIRASAISDYFGEDAPYRIEEGVAFINVSGPLSNARWSWGGTTYGDLQQQLKIAGADPNVRGVLLNVNSPGGETDNAFETADMIAALAEKKPVWGVANTSAYSAAYLMLSQAERIYVPSTSGGVGSIGVYCLHFDYSEFLKDAGIKVTLISAGEGKTAGNPYEPLNDDDEEEIQEEIDRLYGAFVARVAAGRGMAAAKVIELGARLYDGSAKAIATGLADIPGDLETAWVDMCAAMDRGNDFSALIAKRRKGSVAASATNSTQEQSMATGQAQAEAPKTPTAAEIEQMIQQARTGGFDSAAEIVDLCAIAGRTELAAGFITERKNVAEVRKALVDARAKQVDLDPTVSVGTRGQAPGGQGQGTAKPWKEVMAEIQGRKGRN